MCVRSQHVIGALVHKIPWNLFIILHIISKTMIQNECICEYQYTVCIEYDVAQMGKQAAHCCASSIHSVIIMSFQSHYGVSHYCSSPHDHNG